MNQSQTIANRFIINNPEKDLLGHGGMGNVYLATDAQSGESVAVKALSPAATAHDPGLLERFTREGEALRQLHHPNIVRMVTTVSENGQHYLVMEYVSGGSLQDLLAAQGRLPAAQVTKIALEIADALTRAHHLGILHRDIKPANVLLAADGTPRLTDFGIASMSGEPKLTETGILVGTIDYLSPEACQGEQLDERADIWAFGVLLFELLTGQVPFKGANITATLTAILTQPTPDLTQLNPNLPDALVDLVCRMLEKDPQQRIPSTRLVGAEIEALLKGRQAVTPSRLVAIESCIEEIPAPAPKKAKHNLPTQPTTFVGREKEIEEVKEAIKNYRLVTLTGAGGTGKTRLSLQIAVDLVDEFEHGVWFVELASITDPELVLPAIASIFKVKESAETPIEQHLHDYLRDRHLLLVIDNFEQVVSAAPGIGRLLTAAPNVKVLTSSREVLRLRGEYDYPVPPLRLPEVKRKQTAAMLAQYEAIALFIQHARAANPSFELDEKNASTVAEICIQLDGLPLAIELAAARSRLLKPAAMLEKLKSKLSLLTGGARDLPQRQQTIRGAIDWSYELLDDAEKVLFARLGVFVGGWTVESADEVCSDGTSIEMLSGLESLLDKSLLRQFDSVSGETRFTMLETIREYAFEKLSQSGELLNIQQARVNYLNSLLENVITAMNSPKEVLWFAKMDDELDNLRSGVDWTLAHNLPALIFKIGRLFEYWNQRALYLEPLGWLERALASDTGASLIERATALNSAGNLCNMGDNQRARRYYESALDLFREIGDQDGISRCLNNVGLLALNEKDFEKAHQLFEQSLAFEDAGTFGASSTLLNLGHLARIRGNWEQSREYYLHAREICEHLGAEKGFSYSNYFLGILALAQRDLNQAQAYFESALKANWLQANGLACGLFSGLPGYVHLLLGNNKEALRMLTASLESAAEFINQNQIPEYFFVCYILEGKARLELSEGKIKRAAQLFGTSWTRRDQENFAITDAECPDYETAISEIRSALGNAAFDEAFAKGQAMTIEQAIRFALDDQEQ